MEYTQEQKEGFKVEFAKRQKLQYVSSAIAIAAIFTMASIDKHSGVGFGGLPSGTLGPICFVVILAVIGSPLKNWRCPACNGYIGKGMHPRFCNKCGVALK